ncbi:hypothetical protein BJF79_34125 [Actinomadura sp. CNU-125]|uniref:hypothetical protein n=1 Tax=Actinomadura sp. CNU-125 TaxID=1904961 RepID=UPI00095EAF6E|nr:hypothetical protein [Actinomadura sp. CNU-125]OLT33925.1 hypothetical protein BJF79_34125 [Actinomadura sp. CNU-125]
MIDEPAPAIRDATVTALQAPSRAVLVGEKTRQWWAYLAIGADRMLISADSPYRLSDGSSK